MDLGKPIRVVEVPKKAPARQPREQPRPCEDDAPIPLPADWPVRLPVQVPDGSVRNQALAGPYAVTT